ncbi:MAG: hypothetical protein ACPG5W_04195 [Flavobacteriales bacterium]
MPTGGHHTFKTDKYEKAFLGRDHVIAQIKTATQVGNTLELELFDVGTPAQPYNAFRKRDGVLSADMGVWGLVVDAIPGKITIMPAGDGIAIADLVTAYPANNYVKAMGDFEKNYNSGGKERLAQYPDVDYNYSGIKRDSWYQAGREEVKSRVEWGDEMWSDGFADQTVNRLLRKREMMQIWGARGQGTDADGDLFDQNGGVRWSVINRGGEYLPLSAPITETQFDNWLAAVQTRKVGSQDLTVMMGKGILYHIQKNFTQGYIQYAGRENTFGGEDVDGLNVLKYNIANTPVNFIELDALNDSELFPEISSIAGLAMPNRMSHTAFCVDMSPVPVAGGGTAPAIELISRRNNPFMAGYLNGMDKAMSNSQLYGALNSASQVVTDIDASSFHCMIDDGIDMTGKFSGWIELTS